MKPADPRYFATRNIAHSLASIFLWSTPIWCGVIGAAPLSQSSQLCEREDVPLSVEAVDVEINRAETELATKLIQSAKLASRASGYYMKYASSTRSGATVDLDSAQAIALIGAQSNSPQLQGMAYTACHALGHSLTDGACSSISIDTWQAADPSNAMPIIARVIWARANASNEAVAVALRDVSSISKPYDGFVPLGGVVETEEYRSLAPLHQNLIALRILASGSDYALKPILVNYCSKNALTDADRNASCVSLASSVVKTAPIISDRFDAIRVLRQAGVPKEQVKQLAGEVLPLRKPIKKEVVQDSSLTCKRLEQRAAIALNLIRRGELQGYTAYFQQ